MLNSDMQGLQNKQGLYLAVHPLSSHASDTYARLLADLSDQLSSPPNRQYLQKITESKAPERVKIQRLTALTALLQLLSAVLPEASASLCLYRDDHGRPYARINASCPPLDFNLSHTDSMVTCALLLGEGRIGIDAEGLLPYERAHKLAERFYTEQEQEHLSSFTSPVSYAEEVTRLWTVKEAVAKQDGLGNPVAYNGLCAPEGAALHRLRYETSHGFPVLVSLCAPLAWHTPTLISLDESP